jgi:hypothetical protein
MQTASDTNAIRNLHFPSSRPLSVLGQLFLPSEWKFSEQVEESWLPEDPIAVFDKLIAKNESEVGHSATETSITKSDLIEFAVETWRLKRRVEGMDAEKHKREYKQFYDSVRRFVKFLERFEVEFEDPVGKPFTTGWLEVKVVSWDEPGDEISPVESGPWVKQTISPIIRQHGITIKTGQVVCVDIEE